MIDKEMHDKVSSFDTGKFWMDIHPLTKLTIALCCSIVGFFMPGYLYGFALMVLYFFFTLSCGKAKNYSKVMLSILFVFVGLLIISQSLFFKQGPVMGTIGGFSIYLGGFFNGMSMSSVILGFSSSIVFFFATTEPESLMLALEEKKFPPSVSYAVLATFQMIPVMGIHAKVIQDAQRSRGIETEGNLRVRIRAFLPMLMPLLLSSFSIAEERTLALETRGFNAPYKKTRLRILKDSKSQRFFRLVFMVIAVIACVVGGYYKWLV